jgi:adhesin transport system outer membrane protein
MTRLAGCAPRGRIQWYVAGVVAGSLAFTAPDTFAFSIEDAVQLAIRTHPTVQAARELRRAADEGVNQARAGYFPTLDARAAHGWARTNNSSTRARSNRQATESQSRNLWRSESSLTSSQMLWDGWSTRNLADSARARVGASAYQVLDSGELIGLRAVASYLGTIRAKRLYDLAKTNVERHEEVRDKIKIQVDSGGGNAADLDQAKGRLSFAEATLVQFTGGLRDVEAAYIEAIGEPPDEDLVLPVVTPDVLPESSEDAVAQAMDSNPTLQASIENVKAQRKSYAATQAAFRPRFSFDVSGSRNQDVGGAPGSSNDFAALLSMTYNVFRGGGDRASRRAAAALLAEAQQREIETRRLIEQNTRVSYTAYWMAWQRLPVLKSQVESTEQALDAYYEQFALGKRTLLDLLDVEGEVFNARSSLTDAEITVLQSHYSLLAATGRLLSVVDVAVGEEAQLPSE